MRRVDDADGVWVFPAQAGMNRTKLLDELGPVGVPRTGGDEPMCLRASTRLK